jgi:homoserine kinase
VIVRAPASSANLGPGFDALGLALDLPFELAVDESPADGFLRCEPRHPATIAFAAAGGDSGTALWWRSPIPPGRGLGFSGAARVAGAFAASADRGETFATAVALEGHPDNAAASTYGGLVATASGRAVPVHLGVDLEVVVWWPETETSTNASRAALPEVVDRVDAVADIGHTALLVAALAAGDLGALSVAVTDRLHQTWRLSAEPASRDVIDALQAAGAVAAWLSGSGPTVAAFVTPDQADDVLAACPPDGRSRRLRIATDGVSATSPNHS